MLIRNPLQLRYPVVDLDDSNMKASIDAFLKLLISSNKYDSIADEEFGFCLEDFRYEGFSSDEARFLDRTPVLKDTSENTMLSAIKSPLYGKKLIGNSKNADTFARELKVCIERYEKRLKDITVTMDFQKNARIIHVIVTGVITNSANTLYYNEFNIEVW